MRGAAFGNAQTERNLHAELAAKRALARDANARFAGLSDFQLLLSIGKGSFAEVFSARQISLERRVALKISDSAPAEGSLLAKLDHPCILKVHDQRALSDGHLLIVTELVSGGSLGSLIADAEAAAGSVTGTALLETLDARVRGLGEPVPGDSGARRYLRDATREEIVVHFLSQVSSALAHAHAQGVTHCDVKPDNVLVDSAGNARLADFNMSVLESPSQSTSPQGLGGTLPYMAPEVLGAFLRREIHFQPSPSADVFAVGVMLWQMLFGVRAFEDDPRADRETRIAARLRPPAPIVTEPRWQRVVELALECMNPEPVLRPTAESVAKQLRHCANRQLSEFFARPQSGPRKWFFRWPYLGTIPILFVSLLGASLSAKMSLALLEPYPNAHEAYASRVGWVIAFSQFVGLLFGIGVMHYIKEPASFRSRRRAMSLADRARRRDRSIPAMELCSIVVFGIWVATAGLVFAAFRREFSTLDFHVAASQFAVTCMFGAIFASAVYLISMWFVFEIFMPRTLQVTVDAPPSRRVLGRLRRRASRGLFVAAFVPNLAVQTLAVLGANHPLRFSVELLLGGGAIAAAFYLVALAGRTFHILDEAFEGEGPRPVSPAATPSVPPGPTR
ncbi:MAG: serine/threonine protein kinase [Myxococcales bacterium]|nr:serine/threonine protein kinase [Myxococcales bacterium]